MRATVDAIVPDVAKGLRAAIATVVPFYLAGALERPELVWVALGGWLGSLADPGGARASRAAGTFVFATVGGAMVALSLAAAPRPWLATVVLALFGFGTSMLRAIGGWGSGVGTVLLIGAAVAVTGAHGVPLRDGFLFFVGATWALLLSSVVWPVWTHRPMRHAVAKLFTELRDYATALSESVRIAQKPQAPRWGEIARTHQRAIRAALEEARQVAVALRTRRSGESQLGSNLRLLIGNAELEFFALIALAEEVEVLGAQREAAAKTLDGLARTYGEIADRLLLRNVATEDGHGHLELGAETPAGRLAARLVEQSRRARMVARAPDAVTIGNDDPAAPEGQGSWKLTVLAALEDLRDAHSLKSPFFRHAVRVALTVATAFVVGRHVSPTHSHWVTITAAAVLQPYPGATVGRAIERVVGTTLGSVAAVALMLAVRSPWALALAMFPLSTAAVVTKPRSYRLFTFFLTPIFVLFVAHGPFDWWTAAARTADGAIGGLIALVFAVVLFPSREQKRLADALDTVIAAISDYADTMFDIFERGRRTEDSAEKTAAARRAVGIALGDAETSLERMLAEPRSFQHGAEDAVELMTYARRFSAALTALDLQLASANVDVENRAALVEPLRHYVGAVLNAADAFVRDGTRTAAPAPPPLPSGLAASFESALARVARHAELVANVAARESRPQEA